MEGTFWPPGRSLATPDLDQCFNYNSRLSWNIRSQEKKGKNERKKFKNSLKVELKEKQNFQKLTGGNFHGAHLNI